MTKQPTVQQALADIQDQINSINYTFATSLAPNSVKANTINASSLQTLTSQTGTLSINDGGSLSSGQTGYNTGTGFFLGTNSGTAQLSVGNPSGNHMTWDGTDLSITGNISATTGTIGGWTIGATTLTGGGATLDSAGKITLTSAGAFGDALIVKNGTSTVGSLSANSSQLILSTSSGAAIDLNTDASMTISGLQEIQFTSSGMDFHVTSSNPSALLLSDSPATNTAKFGGRIYPANGSGTQSTGYLGWDGTNLEMLGAPVKFSHAIYPGSSGSAQTSVGITSSGGNMYVNGGPLVMSQQFFPATTSNTQQTTISITTDTTFGLRVDASQLHITGAPSTVALRIDNCSVSGSAPTTSLPAGVQGVSATINGTTGHLGFYV